jgi:hypothetical protein
MPIFSQFISRPVLHMLLETDLQQRLYWRAFTPLVVLWGFIYQRLSADHTCDGYLAFLHAGGADTLDPDDPHPLPLSQRLRSESTAAYVQGRNRLPLALVVRARQIVQQELAQQMGTAGRWQGYAVRLLDGTVFRLRPYGDLAATYGQSRNQYGPGYWVMVRAVAAFDLFSQAVVGVAEGPQSSSESHLVVDVLSEETEAETLYIGDRNFGVYTVVQALQAGGHHCLLRMTRKRANALLARNKQGALHSGHSCHLSWSPSGHDQVLQHLPAATIMGRLLYVHLTKAGFRPIQLHLFTTLSDSACYSLEELVALYRLRWQVEVDFRHVKTTLDMASFEVHSAALLRKELAVGMLVYTLVCALMTAAARRVQLKPVQLSFSHCLRRVLHALFTAAAAWSDPRQQAERLLDRLARCTLPRQPDKAPFEPRKLRNPPRSYGLLRGDRNAAREAVRQQYMIS